MNTILYLKDLIWYIATRTSIDYAYNHLDNVELVDFILNNKRYIKLLCVTIPNVENEDGKYVLTLSLIDLDERGNISLCDNSGSISHNRYSPILIEITELSIAALFKLKFENIPW